MKRPFRIFELSKNEQRVVLIVMFVLLALAFIGYERRARSLSGSANTTGGSEIIAEACRNRR